MSNSLWTTELIHDSYHSTINVIYPMMGADQNKGTGRVPHSRSVEGKGLMQDTLSRGSM